MRLVLDHVRAELGGFSLALDAVIDQPVTTVCGPSGAGKTTLLELVAGLRRPQAGRIVLDDEVLDDAAAGLHRGPAARHIGYVPQDLALFPNLDVRSNVMFGARGGGEALAAETLAVLQLDGLLARRIDGLSGGERQRVALARALISAPRLLLLDEPLTGLDAALRERALEHLQRVRDLLRVPMVYVTHDARDAAALEGEVLWLDQGRLVARGGVAEMLEPDPGAVRLRRQPQRT
jgi:molybdate transport system ATP-binding protein